MSFVFTGRATVTVEYDEGTPKAAAARSSRAELEASPVSAPLLAERKKSRPSLKSGPEGPAGVVLSSLDYPSLASSKLQPKPEHRPGPRPAPCAENCRGFKTSFGFKKRSSTLQLRSVRLATLCGERRDSQSSAVA